MPPRTPDMMSKLSNPEVIAELEENPSVKRGQLTAQLHELEDSNASLDEINSVKEEIEKMAA